MFKTIRSQLLLILLVFVSVTILSSAITFTYYINNKDSLSGIRQRIESIYIALLEDVRTMHDFFGNETINPHFFETGRSALLDQHRKNCAVIESGLNELNALTGNENMHNAITGIRKNFERYRRHTDNIVKQIYERGFKDYGLEGKMRQYAHELEAAKKEIGLIKVLQLRRHEKDFIIRQEGEYIAKHKEVLRSIKRDVQRDASIAPARKEAIGKLLDNYSHLFITLTDYEKEIGLKSRQGIKRQIDITLANIDHHFLALDKLAQYEEATELKRIRLIFCVLWLTFAMVSIGAAAYISKRASRSITELEEKINEFVKSEFTVRTVLPTKDSVNEMDKLATNFSIMEQHIVDQMNALKQTNRELQMLFYRTSHDIKTPLCTVRGITNIALRETENIDSREYFLMIDECWENLNEIVDELGLVTDIKGAQFLPEPVNFDALVRGVYNEHRSVEGFDDIVLSLSIATKEQFLSSPSLIRTIFRHLIKNAILYAEKKPVFSYLRISIETEAGNMLRIKVADNGMGIKKEHQDKIFDMFYRATTKAAGTGLGLFIVQNALQKLNGAISVESAEGVGTTFTLLLPNMAIRRSAAERILHRKETQQNAPNLTLDYM